MLGAHTKTESTLSSPSYPISPLSMADPRASLSSLSSPPSLPPNDQLPRRFKVVWRVLLISNFALSGLFYNLRLLHFRFTRIRDGASFFFLIPMSIVNLPRSSNLKWFWEMWNGVCDGKKLCVQCFSSGTQGVWCNDWVEFLCVVMRYVANCYCRDFLVEYPCLFCLNASFSARLFPQFQPH